MTRPVIWLLLTRLPWSAQTEMDLVWGMTWRAHPAIDRNSRTTPNASRDTAIIRLLCLPKRRYEISR